MTFLEKAMEMGESYWNIVDEMCPHHLNLEEEKIGHCMASQEKCKKCWNREMPDTGLNGIDANYKQGIDDAWEFTKELYDHLQEEDVQDLFGVKYGLREVLGKYTYTEAFEILKEYKEKNTIKVGDVIRKKTHETFLVVTHCGKQVFEGIDEDGNIHSHAFEGYEKTGKHIDIKAILEQIGE